MKKMLMNKKEDKTRKTVLTRSSLDDYVQTFSSTVGCLCAGFSLQIS